MNRTKYPITLILALLFTAGLMTACGGGGEKTVEQLLAERQELESKKKGIDIRLNEIDSIIASQDTTNKKDDLSRVQITQIKPNRIDHFINVQGEIVSDNNVMVYPKSQGGVITAVYVDEGQFVNRGDTMARIESEAMKKSKATLEKSLELAVMAYERQSRLWKEEIGSEMQYLQAKNQKETLEKQIEAMQAQISMNQITAPISGTVDKVFAKVGQVVSAMSPVGAFQLINMNDVSFIASLSESYIQKVRKGDSVTIYFSAINDSIRSTIKTVGQSIDPTSRTISVEVGITGSDINLKANMIGEMRLNDATSVNTVVIHQDILRKKIDGHYLFVAEKENNEWIAKKRDVKVGLRSKNNVEITAGLKPGESLVTRGFRELKDGQKINVK